jgi:hypothetical protein
MAAIQSIRWIRRECDNFFIPQSLQPTSRLDPDPVAAEQKPLGQGGQLFRPALPL